MRDCHLTINKELILSAYNVRFAVASIEIAPLEAAHMKRCKSVTAIACAFIVVQNVSTQLSNNLQAD